MKRLILYILLLAVVSQVSSCRRAIEKAQHNIRFEAVDKVERQGMSGAEVVVRVVNDANYKLILKKAAIDVYYAGRPMASFILRERVEIARHKTGSFSSYWKIRTSDPMALYVLEKRIREGDISQLSISYMAEGRAGAVPVKISQQMMPFSEFLNTFGLSFEDVKNYLIE